MAQKMPTYYEISTTGSQDYVVHSPNVERKMFIFLATVGGGATVSS